MIALFDSSAFVKLVVDEPGSDTAARLWADAAAVLASRLAQPEVHAALAAAERAGRLTPRQRLQAAAAFDELWSGVRVVDLERTTAELACRVVTHAALGGADAVHLACALRLGSDRVVLVTWDRRLSAATATFGLRCAPADLTD